MEAVAASLLLVLGGILSGMACYHAGLQGGMLRAIELTRKWKQEDAIIVVREDEALNS